MRQGLVTNVEIWSEVEVCVAVIAACLPTLRPLFAGSSPESIIGSIRSIFSLNSLNNSQHGNSRANQEGYVQTTEEDGFRLHSKGLPSSSYIGTEITASNSGSAEVDRQQIMVKNHISIEEEHNSTLP